MQKFLTARASLVFALAAALSASPALAQGKGKGAEKERAKQTREFKAEQKRPELRRRTEERRETRETRERREARERSDDRYDERYEGRYDPRLERSERQGKRVPPGWCKGRGNPHNTPENCGYGANRRHDDRYEDRDGRYDDRSGDYGRYGSYEQEHEEFHRYLDRKYSELASRRPLDLPYQVRLRSEKRAEHEQWHARAGRSH